ncbi:Gfo/Idh/MocA family protein [Planctomyces sp. SH-PL62]|uniref:Gfo/Idh/MocA family protein n=1 Tax=Planctomyces sp. SH-PL62 TaxID=1636152 RepID=UPI0018D299B6|nr:Gfo/Idh/MocA family oxidoreductase [Planctomyces sp. SH-PL62]
MMEAIPRRTMLRRGALGAAGLQLAAAGARGDGRTGPRVVVGLIGAGGMGSAHLRLLAARPDVEVACVCDVDAERLASAAKLVEQGSGRAPAAVRDLRRLLDDRRIDAVWIATPDHWHAPAAILALDAGKHVYVEKPCCHNIREGALTAEAVARSGKHLQVGTQSRSTAVVKDAVDRVRGGAIGEVLVAKAWNSQLRGSIGKTRPSEPPSQLDYDLWLGPAPAVPYRSNLLPGVWRWWRDFGCGDMGNDGVHDLDVACWGLGVETHPSRIACLGGKSFFDDDQEFPDTQYAVFEYPDAAGPGRARRLIFEQRIWSPYVQEGYENGAAFYGTEGVMIIGHTVGWTLYGPKNRKLAERAGPADLAAHHDDFLACVRGESKAPSAGVAVGHRSAALVHLANIAARVGRVLDFDPRAEAILGDAEAAALVSRRYRDGHWAAPPTA